MYFILSGEEYTQVFEYSKYIFIAKVVVIFLPVALAILDEPVDLQLAYTCSLGIWSGVCVSLMYEVFRKEKIEWQQRILYFIVNTILGMTQGFCFGFLTRFLLYPFPYYYIYPLYQVRLPIYGIMLEFATNRNINHIPIYGYKIIGVLYCVGYVVDFYYPPPSPLPPCV